MIKDVSVLFPKEGEFSIRLNLSRLEGASRFHSFPRDKNLYDVIEGHYSSLDNLLNRHKETKIDSNDVYIIGSRRSYSLAFAGDRIPHRSLPVGIEMRTYASFADIIFD